MKKTLIVLGILFGVVLLVWGLTYAVAFVAF